MKTKLQFRLLALPGILLAATLLMGATLAAPGNTTRVSVTSDETQANGSSYVLAISTNGRYVAFNSDASNLVTGDTNGAWDIFVRDRIAGNTTRVSVASDGTQANADSFGLAISANGRYVAFSSHASNLVTGDTNGRPDVFVYDQQTGKTTRVSVASGGIEGNEASGPPSISADGRYVAFSSEANNLVSMDTNNVSDVFVYDRQSNITKRVSMAIGGVEGDAPSEDITAISADGRYIAFSSEATNLVGGDTNGFMDIFVYDRQIGITTRVSVASDGTQANYYSQWPCISADGRYIGFFSLASNLVSGDTNNTTDIFVHDRQTKITTRVSVASDGVQANGYSSYPISISADGHYVTFVSGASNLVHGDTNAKWDVFVHDRQTSGTTRVSVASDGTQGNGDSNSSSSAFSSDGRYVAFVSGASNLVSGDTNGKVDVFVHENGLLPPTPTPKPKPAALPDTGFPLGLVTVLPEQPIEKAYHAYGDLTLDIPSIGVKTSIVGVPKNDGNWDVTWLGNQAGYLNGTAYPTWNGNSVITGHVWDANNQPGLFVHLKQLKYGDQVKIHGWGQVYTYEVRESSLVWPSSNTVLKHEDKAWVTLVTCEDFNSWFTTYSYRRVVRAVLMRVDAEK
jgi:LPXTG-site transpeptidase (sortase) family protein